MKRKIKFSGQFETSYRLNRGNYGGLGTLKKFKKDWVCTYFYKCRESFSMVFVDKDIIFQCKNSEREKIRSLVLAVEKKLGLKNHTSFGPTQYPDCSWLRVAPFWFKNPIRRSFFTALLRAGRAYDDSVPLNSLKNIKKALYSVTYFQDTVWALNRFFRGFTVCSKKYIPFYSGWQDVFQGKSKKDVKGLLLK